MSLSSAQAHEHRDGLVPSSDGVGGVVNILTVDDEPKNLTVLETVLDSPRYQLIRAESADKALLALLRHDFAVLILDVQMPGVTGFELAQMIKQRKKTSEVPIIFLTAYYNDDHHVIEGYDSGAVDYLLKPINPAILRSKVSVLAELFLKRRQLEEANRALSAEVAERRLVQQQLSELNGTEAHKQAEEQIRPSISVCPAAAQTTGMVVHELSTNTVKYGALSGDDGRINIAWEIDESGVEPVFSICWTEHGGRPIAAPTHRGFGTVVVTKMVEMSLHGRTVLEYSSTGLIWKLACPLKNVLEGMPV
jgi:DNA-binding response OmpR family regulator